MTLFLGNTEVLAERSSIYVTYPQTVQKRTMHASRKRERKGKHTQMQMINKWVNLAKGYLDILHSLFL